MTRGKLISIEGTEGAGKSTALHFIKDYLQDKTNLTVVCTREPGGTGLAEKIREVLLHPSETEKMQRDAELLLMFAARVQHLQQFILPALSEGKWVITDRFIDASYAYQQGGRGIAKTRIEVLDKWLVDDHYPDLTFLLDISPELGFERAEKRGNGKDRIEQEKIDFFTRVREGYLERAHEDPKRVKIIDASQSVEKVQKQIAKILDEFIAEKVT